MLDDIGTVMWKERKGLLRQGGSRARAVLTIGITVVMIAVIMPLQMGRDWVDTAWSLIASVVLPMLLVGTTIPESFAGERERHTLETLLASRLPDRAILFGKLALAIGYGWIMTLVFLLLSLVVVHILHWDGQIMFYKPTIALANVAVSLLMSLLVAGLGVLISLRSATVQGAQQALVGGLMVPLMLVQVVPFIFLSLVPDGRARLVEFLAAVGSAPVALTVLAVWAVVDVGLLLAAIARFRRSRLILS